MHKIIPEIILASQSTPRKQLLEKLQLKFSVVPANIDESALPNEGHYELVERLSHNKAHTVLHKLQQSQAATTKPQDYIIIASDQIAVVENKVYGKPGDFAHATQQLQLFNSKTIEFITGLCVIQQIHHAEPIIFYTFEHSKIKLRNLTNEQITNYLLKDQPYQSAASIKIESLGIGLIESISTNDYNAIIGLPLLKLINILAQINLDILTI